jgi:hypothetical protein
MCDLMKCDKHTKILLKILGKFLVKLNLNSILNIVRMIVEKQWKDMVE